MKILIAEDDRLSRAFLKKAMEKYGACDVAVDGMEAETALYAGSYAGGFQGVWQSDGQGGYVLDGTTLNLESPDEWTDYRALLEDGGYLARARRDAPALDIPVTVYEFTDFTAPAD